MPFKPGESGNVKGRPKETERQKQEKEEFLLLLRSSTVSALQSIVRIASDSKHRDCLAAAKYIIDKSYGVNTAFLIEDTSEPIDIHIVRHEKK